MSADAEWSEGYVSVIGPCTLTCWRVLLRMVNLRPGGPLGESGGSSVGKGRQSDVES
jgi:hypothetical protein